MYSKVAAELRAAQNAAALALSPMEHLLRAQRLGDEALATYAGAHGLTLDAAFSELSRQRQLGRRVSRSARGR